MWPCMRRFISSIIAARVVDLPEPVLPVTRIMPCVCLHIWCTTLGMLSSSSVMADDGMARRIAPIPFRWRNALTRKRDTSGISYAKSAASFSANILCAAPSMISKTASWTNSVVRRSSRSVFRPPCTRARTGSPEMKCRSEALPSSACIRYSSILGMASNLRLVADVENRHQVRVSHETRELLLVVREPDRVVGVDLLVVDRLEQRRVHCLHADVAAHLQL